MYTLENIRISIIMLIVRYYKFNINILYYSTIVEHCIFITQYMYLRYYYY